MRTSFAVLGLFGVAAVAACGLSESGLLDADGGADVNVPEACATVDAACLGALGPEWKPVSVGDAGCAPGFTAQALVTNPRLLDGGCACSACQVTGSFACNGPTRISGGNNCDDPAIAQALTGQCTQAHAQHLQAYVSQATAGTIGCTAANDAGAGATGDDVTACIPTSCTADFCGGGSICAMAEGDVACPSGFTLFGHVGTSVDPGCAACACDASAPGNCSGNVTGFETTNCTDGGLVHTYAVGTCNVFDNNTDYSSVLVTLVPPDASCTTASAAVSGDASLAGEKTICCK
jgi:acyl-coenzyme A thioesterase PaaI-like protein